MSGDPLAGMGGTQASGGGQPSTGNPQRDDTSPIVIQKSEETSVFGNMSATQEVPATPTTPTATPSGMDSLIIVSSEPEATPAPTTSPLIESPTAITTEAVMTPEVTLVEPAVAEVGTPINDSLFGDFSTPSNEGEGVTPETVTPESSNVIEEAPVMSSLFETLETPTSEVETPSEEILSSEEVSTPVTQINFEEVVAPTTSVQEPEEVVSEELVTEVPVFFHPTDFIQKSIADIDTMISNIDEKHEAKISEAEGYKAEKKRFTELEKTAYAEASVMDEEKDHALHMRKLLVSELPENKGSHIEASLTGIAVASTVEKTIDKPRHHAKVKAAAV